MKNKDLKKEVKALKDALWIAANRLEGVSIAIKVHGQNINTEFFIKEYSNYADEARKSLKNE